MHTQQSVDRWQHQIAAFFNTQFAMSATASTPFPVTVHPYPSPKVRQACAYELGPSSARNAIVFIGGLTDGPHTVPYIRTVAAKIQATAGLDYSVFEIRMRSSFFGFAWSSLSKDVEDISALVKYLRGLGKQKIILFGHSTGCQVGRINRNPHCASSPIYAADYDSYPHRTASSIPITTSTITSSSMASSSRVAFRTAKDTEMPCPPRPSMTLCP